MKVETKDIRALAQELAGNRRATLEWAADELERRSHAQPLDDDDPHDFLDGQAS